MKFYKIRHKATGLFYKPGRWPKDIDISKTGKVYQTKPTLKWLPCYIGWPIGDGKQHPWSEDRKLVPDEWEIVEFDAS